MPRVRIDKQLETSVATGSVIVSDSSNEAEWIKAPFMSIVTQAAHGFTIGVRGFIPVYVDAGGVYQSARANSSDTLHTGFIVEIIDANTFRYVPGNSVITKTVHGLTVGNYYYLSEATAGANTLVEPDISAPTVFVLSTSELQLITPRPFSTADERITYFSKTADQTFISNALTTIGDIGTVNLDAGNTYIVNWYIRVSRSINATMELLLDATNIDFGHGKVSDHNGIDRVEFGVVEALIQVQQNNEFQMLNVEAMIKTNGASVVTLQMAQTATDAGNPHTIGADSFVRIEKAL